MNRVDERCRDTTRRPALRTRRPDVEILEDRLLLSTSDGGRWTYGSRITFSFMPDGTNIGGSPSTLFQSLNARFATATWEQQFAKAAGVWQAVANLNLALVPDDGSSVGVAGNQQDDPRFGDIRIGALPLSPGILGDAFLPPPVNGDTVAGDILMNSSIAWQINNDYDLETVAIHELGHALGMGHSAIQAADMYAYYTCMKQNLNADDIGGIQSIYGAVPADATNNTTSATAIDLTPLLNPQAQAMLSGQYVTGSSDLEWYKVTVPSTSSGTMVATMQATNLSMLSPRLAVFNGTTGTLVSLGQAALAGNYGGTVTFKVTGILPGQVYDFRASDANVGAGVNGAFGIGVNFGTSPQIAATPPDTVVASQPDQGGGYSGLTAPPVVDAPASQDPGPRDPLANDRSEAITIGSSTFQADALRIGHSTVRGPALGDRLRTTFVRRDVPELVTLGTGPGAIDAHEFGHSTVHRTRRHR